MIGPNAPVQLECEQKEKRPADRGDRAIDVPANPSTQGSSEARASRPL